MWIYVDSTRIQWSNIGIPSKNWWLSHQTLGFISAGPSCRLPCPSRHRSRPSWRLPPDHGGNGVSLCDCFKAILALKNDPPKCWLQMSWTILFLPPAFYGNTNLRFTWRSPSVSWNLPRSQPNTEPHLQILLHGGDHVSDHPRLHQGLGRAGRTAWWSWRSHLTVSWSIGFPTMGDHNPRWNG